MARTEAPPKSGIPPKPSASGASTSPPGCVVAGCPLADLIVHVRQDSAGGAPIAGATVSIEGASKHSATTNAAGDVTFAKITPGAYKVHARAKDFSPDPAETNASPPAGGKQEVTMVLIKAIVITIKAKVPGTKGVRKPATDTRPENVLTSSSSKEESLAANPPVILVRGCKDVELEAVTTPANMPVTWQVKANENTDKPPVITPTDGGKKAKLKTNVHGSLSVIATLGGKKVVWNVVFVWVKVDVKSSVVVTRDNKYADAGSGAGWTSFRSGQFSAGQYAWEAKVQIKVVGGGNSKTLGTDKVKLHYLQNGVADTLTGNYAAPGVSATEVPKGGLPVLDATGAGNPWAYVGSVFAVTPNNTAFKRAFWCSDSPAGSFPTKHKNKNTALQSISGVNAFVASIASVSDDAPTALMVHAKIAWSADFAGTVDAAGVYTPNGAKTTADAAFSGVSAATGGQDAGDAGLETFDPRFNGGTDTTWVP